MSVRATGAARVAGVVGRPIAHSLSPVIHGAWIEAAGLDALYAPFSPQDEPAFERLVRGFRGGVVAGLNVTAPFKERALALSDEADPVAIRAGSANLLLFHEDGHVEARSTDGFGMIAAFAEQAPEVDLTARPAVVLGAGGAAKAAVAALLDAGSPEVRVVNRTIARAEELVFAFGERTRAFALADAERALDYAGVLVNAAAAGPVLALDHLPEGAAVMDMTYRPLKTALLQAAEARGLPTVDGLSMLINQAKPSFEALFGQAPPDIDVRAVALEALK
ncbi:shikimate dehydrogenase [Caulobacter sp. 17J80-11]|uniref:shikimate dehydrogenase family protein n=1 Tax=Caulobacter sp. 17J80-11 TaxID=2763502 RepID=UPI0016538AD9|nr:shikimate dehydrogenase [Caulobacter sp. 17J80-11]MBC6983336.1 shikimate dehydrogenase [Caulobacter sp. 17J80-11]